MVGVRRGAGETEKGERSSQWEGGDPKYLFWGLTAHTIELRGLQLSPLVEGVECTCLKVS